MVALVPPPPPSTNPGTTTHRRRDTNTNNTIWQWLVLLFFHQSSSSSSSSSWITKKKKMMIAMLILLLILTLRLRNRPVWKLEWEPPLSSSSASSSSSVPSVCPGRAEYQAWIDALFALAPTPAPNCTIVQEFTEFYRQNSAYWANGAIVLQRNNNNNKKKKNSDSNKNYNDAFEIMHHVFKPPAGGGRKGFFTKIWRDANLHRNLPPNLEMILYVNDKPRVNTKINPLPVFVIAGQFPAGSGRPTQWPGYAPFPSHFMEMPVSPDVTSLSQFRTQRPVVYYRGKLSEISWSRYNRSDEFMSTPRFKLAYAVSHLPNPDDHVFVDIQLTDIAAAGGEAAVFIRQNLQRRFNITLGDFVPASDGQAQMSLSVPGNGWPGATTMRGLTSSTAMLMVRDTTIDHEGISRDMGEIYFPFLESGRHYIPVEYDTIASTARSLLQPPQEQRDGDNDTTTTSTTTTNYTDGTEHLFQINTAASEFTHTYLGYTCALDIVELLAWRYYEYVLTGCPTAFSHVSTA
jgi:hypothetical protein